VQESWIRRQGWNAGHENGWLCCGYRGAHVLRGRWSHRGPAAPSRSASQLPTPTVSLQNPTRSAPRPETASPTPIEPSPAVSSSRPTEEPTPRQEPTPTRSATKNPSRSPIRVETTSTQTVTAAPSPSTVTRSVTISPSPTASPSPSSPAAGEPAETSTVSWFWWALAGLLLAAAIATPLLVRAHRRRVWRADFGTAEQEVAWFARVLVPELGQSTSLDQVGAAGPSARIA
jgi:hypothetical protein